MRKLQSRAIAAVAGAGGDGARLHSEQQQQQQQQQVDRRASLARTDTGMTKSFGGDTCDFRDAMTRSSSSSHVSAAACQQPQQQQPAQQRSQAMAPSASSPPSSDNGVSTGIGIGSGSGSGSGSGANSPESFYTEALRRVQDRRGDVVPNIGFVHALMVLDKRLRHEAGISCSGGRPHHSPTHHPPPSPARGANVGGPPLARTDTAAQLEASQELAVDLGATQGPR